MVATIGAEARLTCSRMIHRVPNPNSPRLQEQLHITSRTLGAIRLQVFGASDAAVVITGDIIDGSGKLLGTLPDAQAKAIEAWERLMSAWEISLR